MRNVLLKICNPLHIDIIKKTRSSTYVASLQEALVEQCIEFLFVLLFVGSKLLISIHKDPMWFIDYLVENA